MKQYNCPDYTHTEDTCENCSKYRENYRTNLNEYDPWWHYLPTQPITNIPPACRNCPNHPSNGGSRNCNCILGTQTFY